MYRGSCDHVCGCQDDAIAQIHDWVRGRDIALVECLWEPGMYLAAKLRERLRG